MKITILTVFFVMIFSLAGFPNDFGKIMQIAGTVDLTDTYTGSIFEPGVGTRINKDHRIRTAKNSYAEIVLNEGTKIFLYELSVMKITYLKIKRSDSPSRIKILTGKVRIDVSRANGKRTLILETPTALAGVADTATDFAAIATSYEARVVVYNGILDIANINREVIKSFRLIKKEESIIGKNLPPTEPVTTPMEILNNWLENYIIVDKRRIVLKSKEEGGIIGHILRKRKF